MVHGREETLDVTLQHIARPRAVPADSPDHLLQCCNAPVRPLPHATGVRMWNKGRLKERGERREHRVVDNPVAHPSLVDLARLRIINAKCRVGAVPVALRCKIAVELEEILLQTARKLLDVTLLAFPFLKRLPRAKKRFRRNHGVENAMVGTHGPV